MKDIAIFGAGGFGKEVASLIHWVNRDCAPTWNIIGFFDDGVEKGSKISHFGEVLGGMSELNAWDRPLDVAIAIGAPSSLQKVRERIENENITFPNVIAPNFGISDKETFEIGEGNVGREHRIEHRVHCVEFGVIFDGEVGRRQQAGGEVLRGGNGPLFGIGVDSDFGEGRMIILREEPFRFQPFAEIFAHFCFQNPAAQGKFTWVG